MSVSSLMEVFFWKSQNVLCSHLLENLLREVGKSRHFGICDVCKLDHVSQYGQKMMENFSLKMRGTVYTESNLSLLVPEMYEGQN